MSLLMAPFHIINLIRLVKRQIDRHDVYRDKPFTVSKHCDGHFYFELAADGKILEAAKVTALLDNLTNAFSLTLTENDIPLKSEFYEGTSFMLSRIRQGLEEYREERTEAQAQQGSLRYGVGRLWKGLKVSARTVRAITDESSKDLIARIDKLIVEIRTASDQLPLPAPSST